MTLQYCCRVMTDLHDKIWYKSQRSLNGIIWENVVSIWQYCSKPREKKKHGKYKVGQLARWPGQADRMFWNILEQFDPRDHSGLPSISGLTDNKFVLVNETVNLKGDLKGKFNCKFSIK